MGKYVNDEGFSFYDYWDSKSQKIKLDLENYMYYFEKPAINNQENLIFHQIPYQPDFFLPIIKMIIQKATEKQIKVENIKKLRLKNSFLSIWKDLPELEPSRIDALLNLYRKRLFSHPKKKKELVVGVILVSNQMILFHAKSNSVDKKGYWRKIPIEEDPEKYIKDKMNQENLLRASIITFDKNSFFLTIYEHNYDVSKGHVRFWGLEVLHADDLKSEIWARDHECCHECGKNLLMIKRIDPLEEIAEELRALKEIQIYKWESDCWSCKKKTPRVSYCVHANFDYFIGDIHKLDEILTQKYPFVKKTFSNERKQKVIANTCVYCNALQGNFYISEEIIDDLLIDDIDDIGYQGLSKFLDTVIPNNLTLEDLHINKEDPMFRKDIENEKFGHVHHIDGDKTNNTLENLILLCPSCHKKIHSK